MISINIVNYLVKNSLKPKSRGRQLDHCHSLQVKVRRELGTSQEFPVVVCSGGVPGGPARLHVREGTAALVGGRPPALLAVWQLDQLRYLPTHVYTHPQYGARNFVQRPAKYTFIIPQLVVYIIL